MSSGLPSDEVAEDYKNALEDLVTNDKFSIANLTMIAKENIEHAEAISRVLTNHINRAPPNQKLPALYVLDSVVKNVGSPYTVYFGRNIFHTFMDAYSKVGSGPMRKKLEEMFNTWRQPVPGSMSTTPVFPLATTQSIVDALNRFRAVTAQPHNQRQQSVPDFRPPHMQVATTYRNTPTPPQMHPTYGQYPTNSQNDAAAAPHASSSYHSYPNQTQTPVYNPPPPQQWQPPTPQPQPTYSIQQPSQPQQQPATMVDLPKLHADIDNLTTDAKIQCATHPRDTEANQRLVSLQQLKEILDSGAASNTDLIEIEAAIREMGRSKAQQQQVSAPQQRLPAQMPYMPQQPSTQPSYPTPDPAVIASLMRSTNLAELLRAPSYQQSTPQPQPAYPTQYMPAVQNWSTPPITHSTPAHVNPPVPQLPIIPDATRSTLERLFAGGLFSSTPAPSSVDVQFSTASIKVVRQQNVTSFLNARPNQCTTCGKRFTTDEEGQQKKKAHLDWHFKAKTRMVDAEKRGLNRSWYVDEREWIASKEFDDDVGTNGDINTSNGISPSAKPKQKDRVKAPDGLAMHNTICPIDQEKLKLEFDYETGEAVFMDAIKVGDKYYHASCYRDQLKDSKKDSGVATPSGTAVTRTATPDSVLGKRKAERSIEESTKSRVKLEI